VNNRTPVRKRRFGPPRRGSEPDEAYKKWLRKLPCVVCARLEISKAQFVFSHIEAAHVGARGLGQKCPDRQCVPLCIWHHTAGPHCYHRSAKTFWSHWKLDRFELIEGFNARYEEETGIPRKPIRDEVQPAGKKEIA
jgi:hypothetical protein